MITTATLAELASLHLRYRLDLADARRRHRGEPVPGLLRFVERELFDRLARAAAAVADPDDVACLAELLHALIAGWQDQNDGELTADELAPSVREAFMRIDHHAVEDIAGQLRAIADAVRDGDHTIRRVAV